MNKSDDAFATLHDKIDAALLDFNIAYADEIKKVRPAKKHSKV